MPVPVIDSAASSLRSCELFDTVIVPLLASVVLSDEKVVVDVDFSSPMPA